VSGVYVPPEEKAEFDSLRSYFDAKTSLDRIDDYAKWIFASSAVVGALGAGLSNAGLAKARGPAFILFAIAVFCLGIALLAASLSIAPRISEVWLKDIDNLRKTVNEHFRRRQRFLTAAAGFYALAIFLAALVPVVSEVMPATTPHLSYSVDARGAITADVTESGMKQGGSLQLALQRKGANLLVLAGGDADQSGEANAHLGPVPLDSEGTTDLVVRRRLSGDSAWQETSRISIQR
jgi:hypothetical protein